MWQVAYANGVKVGEGAQLSLGDGQLRLNCLDVLTEGRLMSGMALIESVNDFKIGVTGLVSAGTSDILVRGNWENLGQFSSESSHVSIEDGCARDRSQILGDSSFYQFSATTNSGKTLMTEAESLQEFNHLLTLKGSPVSGRLKIRSSMFGVSGFFSLNPSGSQDIFGVDVQDNDASMGQLLAPGAPESSASLDSGQNLNWFLDLPGVEPIPANSRAALLMLILLVGILASINLRSEERNWRA